MGTLLHPCDVDRSYGCVCVTYSHTADIVNIQVRCEPISSETDLQARAGVASDEVASYTRFTPTTVLVATLQTTASYCWTRPAGPSVSPTTSTLNLTHSKFPYEVSVCGFRMFLTI